MYHLKFTYLISSINCIVIALRIVTDITISRRLFHTFSPTAPSLLKQPSALFSSFLLFFSFSDFPFSTFFSVFYFHTKLEISNPASSFIYFGYTFLMSYAFCLLTGAVGFISTFWFVRAIYGAIKVD